MKQTLRFIVEIDVDADAASRLPGFPGENYGEEIAEPIAGIQIESDIICDELMQVVMERLPKRLQAQAVLNRVQISTPFNPEDHAIK